MTTPDQILSSRGNPSQINIVPKPYVLQARNIQRRQSPAAELLQENNSLLSSRINASLITPASNSRIASSSGCRGVKRERVATAISVGKDGENSKREGETNRKIMHTESIKARIAGQLNSKPPLAANQGPTKENQSRCQAPLKARKNSNLPEPKSAMLPSSSTGKLIERSRQKVAEKHASREQTLTERENSVANQQDQLLSMIELTKNNLYKDQKVIRHFMNKHKKTIESLEQKHYEKSFEGRKI